jgi:hypothetical protein
METDDSTKFSKKHVIDNGYRCDLHLNFALPCANLKKATTIHAKKRPKCTLSRTIKRSNIKPQASLVIDYSDPKSWLPLCPVQGFNHSISDERVLLEMLRSITEEVPSGFRHASGIFSHLSHDNIEDWNCDAIAEIHPLVFDFLRKNGFHIDEVTLEEALELHEKVEPDFKLHEDKKNGGGCLKLTVGDLPGFCGRLGKIVAGKVSPPDAGKWNPKEVN